MTTLVILFLMTGSVVLPIKTLLMNVLTLSAAFGLLVLIFQDGRLEGLLDFSSEGALESTEPILLFAIGAFATSEIIFIKEVGVGTALAVIIDATIVRALLVPSLMKLLGSRNWWAPRPLARLHARYGPSEARVAGAR